MRETSYELHSQNAKVTQKCRQSTKLGPCGLKTGCHIHCIRNGHKQATVWQITAEDVGM